MKDHGQAYLSEHLLAQVPQTLPHRLTRFLVPYAYPDKKKPCKQRHRVTVRTGFLWWGLVFGDVRLLGSCLPDEVDK